jgi:hypothetical protein
MAAIATATKRILCSRTNIINSANSQYCILIHNLHIDVENMSIYESHVDVFSMLLI